MVGDPSRGRSTLLRHHALHLSAQPAYKTDANGAPAVAA